VSSEEWIPKGGIDEVGDEPGFAPVLDAVYELAHLTPCPEGADRASEGRVHPCAVRATTRGNQHAEEGVAARRATGIRDALKPEQALGGKMPCAVIERRTSHGAVAGKDQVDQPPDEVILEAHPTSGLSWRAVPNVTGLG
jgi:hypothetical protein